MFIVFGFLLISGVGIRLFLAFFKNDDQRELRIHLATRNFVIWGTVGVASILWSFYSARVSEQAFQKELRDKIVEVMELQEQYLKLHGRFASSFNELNVQSSNLLQFYLSDADTPTHIRNSLCGDDRAFISKDDYQFVVHILRRPGHDPEFLVQSGNGNLRGISKAKCSDNNQTVSAESD